MQKVDRLFAFIAVDSSGGEQLIHRLPESREMDRPMPLVAIEREHASRLYRVALRETLRTGKRVELVQFLDRVVVEILVRGGARHMDR